MTHPSVEPLPHRKLHHSKLMTISQLQLISFFLGLVKKIYIIVFNLPSYYKAVIFIGQLDQLILSAGAGGVSGDTGPIIDIILL